MKKILLTLAGSIFISMAVLAQEQTDTTGTQSTDPSTNYRRPDTENRNLESGTPSETGTPDGKSETGMNWRDEDRESVSSEDLPEGLLETLKDDQYSGWENATIYRNRTSEDYMLVIQDDQGSTRTFYFDSEGREHTFESGDDQSSMQQPESSASGTSRDMSNESSESTGSDPTSAAPTYPMETNPDRSQENVSTGMQGDSGVTGSDTQPSQENPGNNATGATSTSSGTTTPSGTSDSDLRTDESSTTLSTEQPSTSWRAEDRVVILSSDIPASLRVTLEDDTYKGWENSTIYQNRQTNEYMIEIRDGSNSRIYYFDKDGKALQISGPEGQ